MLLLYLSEAGDRLRLILDVVLSKFEITFYFLQDRFGLLVSLRRQFNLLIRGLSEFFEFGL